MQVTILGQFKSWKYCSKHKWRYKLRNVPAVAVRLDPLASYIYIHHETSYICLQPRPSFAWILSLRNIVFPIIGQYSWSSNVLFYEKKTLWTFHGWASTASRLEWKLLWGGSLLFTIKLPEIAGTHFLSTSEGKTTQILKSDPKECRL